MMGPIATQMSLAKCPTASFGAQGARPALRAAPMQRHVLRATKTGELETKGEAGVGAASSFYARHPQCAS